MPETSTRATNRGIDRPINSLLPLAGGTVDQLFRIGNLVAEGGSVHCSMRTGAWVEGATGAPSPGAIGVLMDVVLGGAAMRYRPTDSWAVTTRLDLNFAKDLPSDGSVVDASATCVNADDMGGMATGSANDADGNLLVQGTTWIQFTPRMPDAERERRTPPPLRQLPWSMQELLGATEKTDPHGLNIPTNSDLLNAHGSLHGGVVVSLAEHAATRHLANDRMNLSALNTTFLRPAHGELTVEVRDTHRGRTLSVLEVTIADATGRSCAVSTATYRRREVLR